MILKTVRTLAVALLATTAVAASAHAQEKVLRIGMTAADIPRTLGQPDQGFEGNRFTGIPIYDSLTQWDLSKADAASVVIPGVATEWAVDPNDTTKWVFTLRDGRRLPRRLGLRRGRRGVETCRSCARPRRRRTSTRASRRHRLAHAHPALGPG